VRALKKKQQSKKVCGSGSFDGSLLPGTLLINNPSRESFVFVQASAFALARWCQLALFADRPETWKILSPRTRHTFTASERVCVLCHTMRMTKHAWPLSSAFQTRALWPKMICFCTHPRDILLMMKNAGTAWCAMKFASRNSSTLNFHSCKKVACCQCVWRFLLAHTYSVSSCAYGDGTGLYFAKINRQKIFCTPFPPCPVRHGSSFFLSNW
jgi:hypothetical protein